MTVHVPRPTVGSGAQNPAFCDAPHLACGVKPTRGAKGLFTPGALFLLSHNCSLQGAETEAWTTLVQARAEQNRIQGDRDIAGSHHRRHQPPCSI